MTSRGLALLVLSAVLGLSPSPARAQPDAPREPFKLGTFDRGGTRYVGLVLKDTTVYDLAAANADYERAVAGAAKVTIPGDMKELIAQWDTGLDKRVYAIANRLAETQARPPYAADAASARTLPPILLPETLLNAAVNYTEHAQEMAGRGADPGPVGTTAEAPKPAPGLWERRADDARHNPYLFLKPRAAVVGNGDAIRLPEGRSQVDWECELAIVVGKRASHVPIDKARDHIFGYTLENDVSDRGGRGDRRHGSDWLIGKGHDTFAPLGPYIVPKEFVPDPQKLAIKFTLSGKVMQDSSTARMTHNVYELVHFASNILTLQPGDVIATGSPAGVGAARNVFMKAGDTSVCTIEGIGTLTNPVVAASAATSSASSSRP